jgi:long-chain acyl-CoA synthetase
MNFLENIVGRLKLSPARDVLQETRDGQIVSVTGEELQRLAAQARGFLRRAGLKRGDRCALLAPNSIRWTAADLAIMAEGAIAVPLYSRQAPSELVAMMKDCSPALIICGDESLRASVLGNWPEAPRIVLLDELFDSDSAEAANDPPAALADRDAVTIIYTSGTSGEPKGVILNAGNVTYMLSCTNARLDLLMGPRNVPDRVFHYLPTCFAGSWILLLTCLARGSVLTLSTDLTKLGDELKLAPPDYMLNVPVLLERIRAGVEEQIAKREGFVQTLFNRGREAWLRRQAGQKLGVSDALVLALARRLVFRTIRSKVGPNLLALICGSAPLAKETQLFFMMLGLPVLQVYGLTETTAICTMDHPHQVVPGRVGPAIPGTEMRLGEDDEVLVRGPNIFPGYWNRPAETEKAFADGWFRTGDQGEVDAQGNWSIIGRIKNLIIPASGHNVAPEPIEDLILNTIPGAKQVMLVGTGRAHLAAIITGAVTREQVEAALEQVNSGLPHYKRVRGFHISSEPFTIENGLLTTNGKFKRGLIAAKYREEIETLYEQAAETAKHRASGP